MKKLSVWLLATLAAVLIAGCAGDKAPAERAVANAETAIAQVRDAATKYAPDQMQAVDAQFNSIKDNLAKGDYKAVLAAMPRDCMILAAWSFTAWPLAVAVA